MTEPLYPAHASRPVEQLLVRQPQLDPVTTEEQWWCWFCRGFKSARFHYGPSNSWRCVTCGEVFNG